jgi:hypothetical protein
MYVERIELAGFDDGPVGQPNQGIVVLVGDGQRLQIPLTLPRRIEMTESRQRLLLLAAALREVRRLPHYRRRGRLRFAPGILPPELRRQP